MSQWLVSHIPSLALLIGLIVIISGGAVLGQKLIRRRYPQLAVGEHNDVTKFTYGFIGFVYAFFIGFVVSAMWGQISSADTAARAEGAAAVQMARDLSVFEQADQDRIRDALLAYEQAAVAEWTNAHAAVSEEADRALAEVYTVYQQVQAKTDVQKTFLSTSFSNLDKMSQARTARISTARSDVGPPWPLWAVIFLTSAMVLGTVIIYGVEKPGQHYPIVAIVGAIIAMNLYLVLQLSHPYVGEIATSSDPLQAVVQELTKPR